MDVEIRTLEPRKTMLVRRTVPKEQLGEAFMENLPKVGAYVGGGAAGAPFGRYPSYADDAIEVEIGIPVAEHLPPSGDIEPGEIPGGSYAVAVHRGSYDGLPGTYQAVYAWIHANGHRDDGAPFESYLDDPGSVAPDDLRTEVCVPIAAGDPA